MTLNIIENLKKIDFNNENIKKEMEKESLNRIEVCFDLDKLKICVSVDLNEKKAYVNVLLDGRTILTGILNENNFCINRNQEICYRLICLEQVEVCIDWNSKKVTAKGKICLTSVCQDFDLIILQW